jgi:DNA-directed RNA polymerase specialized sigma24 family protein
MLDEAKLIQRLKGHDIRAFKQLVNQYSDELLLVAYALTGSGALASEIVARTLLAIFNEAAGSDISPPLKPYLEGQVRRACGNSAKK